VFEFVDKTLLEILEQRTNGLDVSKTINLMYLIARNSEEVHLPIIEGHQLLPLKQCYS